MQVDILDARFVASAVDQGTLPAPAFAEVAFAGRSNVGKSSLINSLVVRRKLVRTSRTPGATRGLNLFRTDLAIRRKDEEPQRATLDLVDLPGYGFAKRSKTERRSWGPMIEDYLQFRVGLRAVVVIVDVRRGVRDEDAQLVEYLDHLGRETILVATKLDKLAQHQRLPRLAVIKTEAARPIVGVSSETGEGKERLWNRLLAAMNVGLPRIEHRSDGDSLSDTSYETAADPGNAVDRSDDSRSADENDCGGDARGQAESSHPPRGE